MSKKMIEDGDNTLKNAGWTSDTTPNSVENPCRFDMAPGRPDLAKALADLIVGNRIGGALKLMKLDRLVLLEPCEYKANPDSPSAQIMTPLQYAIKYGYTPLEEACKAMMRPDDIKQQTADLQKVPSDKGGVVDKGSTFSFSALLTLTEAHRQNPEDEQKKQNDRDAMYETPSWLLATTTYCRVEHIEHRAESFEIWSAAVACWEDGESFLGWSWWGYREVACFVHLIKSLCRPERAEISAHDTEDETLTSSVRKAQWQ